MLEVNDEEAAHSKDGSRVWCVQWNHDGALLATCGDDRTIKVWKRDTHKPFLKVYSVISGSHERTVRNVSFSPCGHYLASCGFDSAVVVYEHTGGDFEEMSKLEGHESEVKCCTFSPSGQFLASCSRDKSVWFWQMDEENDFQVASILQPHTQDVKYVVWHPSEELLVSCSYDCSMRIFRFDGEDWITQQKIDDAHDSTVWSADFSRDGNHFVSVGADGYIRVWKRRDPSVSVERSEWVQATSYDTQSEWPLYTVSWSKLGGLIAVGGGDRMLRLFEFIDRDGEETLNFISETEFSSDVNCVAWNPCEENILAVGTDSGRIRVMEAKR